MNEDQFINLWGDINIVGNVVFNGTVRLRNIVEWNPGVVYAPYIPLMVTPEIINPTRMISSRYAMRMVNNSFYGLISTTKTFKFLIGYK